jgi:hypothetical protein
MGGSKAQSSATPSTATLKSLGVKRGSYILNKSVSTTNVGKVCVMTSKKVNVLWMNGFVGMYQPGFLVRFVQEFGFAEEDDVDEFLTAGWVYDSKNEKAIRVDDLEFTGSDSSTVGAHDAGSSDTDFRGASGVTASKLGLLKIQMDRSVANTLPPVFALFSAAVLVTFGLWRYGMLSDLLG